MRILAILAVVLAVLVTGCTRPQWLGGSGKQVEAASSAPTVDRDAWVRLMELRGDVGVETSKFLRASRDTAQVDLRRAGLLKSSWEALTDITTRDAGKCTGAELVVKITKWSDTCTIDTNLPAVEVAGPYRSIIAYAKALKPERPVLPIERETVRQALQAINDAAYNYGKDFVGDVPMPPFPQLPDTKSPPAVDKKAAQPAQQGST